MRETTGPAWPDQLYDLLRRWQVGQFAYVPDAGHARLIERAGSDGDVHAVPLASEEEGVALMAGADLGGQRAVLLLQSSGVGNCVNMMSLARTGRFPMLMLVSMRGEYGEANPWQVPMAQAVRPVLDAMGFLAFPVQHPDEVEPVAEAAAGMVWRAGQAAALLLTQRLIGAKRF